MLVVPIIIYLNIDHVALNNNCAIIHLICASMTKHAKYGID